MDARELKKKFLNFFEERRHAIIPSAPLIPEHDPSTLFISAGMHPLIPFLLGQPHPQGKRLAGVQKCFRTTDIEDVGDDTHNTFFEMLGNWSLGDYFKEEQLPWCFEFFTKAINLDPNKLYVSVFAGDKIAPKDDISIKLWQQLFKTNKPELPGEKGFNSNIKIYSYDATQNWWSRAGTPNKMPPGEIGGTTSEVFYDLGPDHKFHEQSKWKNQPCHINCDCGRFMEIGNSVFMEYEKQKDESFKTLPSKNVDFGGGFERIITILQKQTDVFQTDLFLPIIKVLTDHTSSKYQDHAPAFRRISDHIKGAVIMGVEGIVPSNKEQGYFMRRLIRRSLLSMRQTKIDYTDTSLIKNLTTAVANVYQHSYPQVKQNQAKVSQVISDEAQKFVLVLDRGVRQLESLKTIDGKVAFDLYQSYGLPLEVTQELLAQMGKSVDKKRFKTEFARHQEISRAGSVTKFKGGLADQSETTIKLHTATHLLHKALRDILGDHIHQEGSNITADRLRFDFTHSQSLADEEIQKIENLINKVIKQDLPVTKTIEDKGQALKSGALAFFKETYPDKVSVYTIGKDPNSNWWSRELCGGPHVSSTDQIGGVKIKKEEAIGAGKRRIYAVLQ